MAPAGATSALEERLAARLAALRAERGWSMDVLAARSGVSRSTLSRLERGETAPTATVLNTLCGVYGLTLSRLFGEVEGGPLGVVRADRQLVWTDPASGFVRRSVSPPHPGLRGEVVRGELPAGAVVDYDRPPVSGLEHHLWLLGGALSVAVEGPPHRLAAGDCLRYRLHGASRFESLGPPPASYVLVLVQP